MLSSRPFHHLATALVLILSACSLPRVQEEWDTSLIKEVRQRIESLRQDPVKFSFRYGVNPIYGYSEAASVIFDDLDDAAEASPSVIRLLQEYERDSDKHIRALAYEVLALRWKTRDDSSRPPPGTDPESIRREIAWLIEDIKTSRHGGHYAGISDVDDICQRCSWRWYDIYDHLLKMPRKEAVAILDQYQDTDNIDVRWLIHTLRYDLLTPSLQPIFYSDK
jgi:hypothetical protein